MKTPEEIKKGLECCSVVACGSCPYEYYCNLENGYVKISNDALAYIQQLENHISELTEKVSQFEAAHPKWISVKEQKPKKGQYVLTCDSIGIQQVLCYNAIKDGFTTLRNHRPFYVHNITHWMPLPEPPKDDCNEQ